MKTIKVTDVKDIPALDVEPGMITADLGVIVSIDVQEGAGKHPSSVFFNGMANQVTYATSNDTVQVIGRVTDEMLLAYQDVVSQRENAFIH